MLYPLSYEGLRPTSYRPAEKCECPASRPVPPAANRCRGSGSAAGGARAEHVSAVATSNAQQFRTSPTGAIGSRRLTEQLRAVRDLTFRYVHATVPAPVPRGAIPAAASLGRFTNEATRRVASRRCGSKSSMRRRLGASGGVAPVVSSAHGEAVRGPDRRTRSENLKLGPGAQPGLVLVASQLGLLPAARRPPAC